MMKLPKFHLPRDRSTGQRGFTLTELMIVVVIIGLLAAIAIPGFVHAREASWRSMCVSTLKAMEGAKAQAAMDLRWSGDVGAHTLGNPLYKDTVSRYLRAGVRPVCPSGHDCYYNPIGSPSTCTSGLSGHEL